MMMEVQPPLSLSWVGSSCLCSQDAERELIALREKVILHNKGELCITLSLANQVYVRHTPNARRLFVANRLITPTFRCTY